jgi:mannose-6-phosphate isomerase-like protein (cupin superfamily)
MSTQAALNASEESIGLEGINIRFLLTGDDTNGSMSIFEMMVPAGRKIPAPAHKNDAYEETLYGIQGVLTWTIDGKIFEVGPGQAVCIPRGAVHRFDNFGHEDAKQLVVVAPAIMGPAYFRDVVDVMRAAAGGPPDPKIMGAIFRRHGMTISAPPSGVRQGPSAT